MCGICGVVQREPIDLERLRAMRDALVHRGPDDAGMWTSAGVRAFGRSGVQVGPDRDATRGYREARTTLRAVPPQRPPFVGLGHRRLSILDLSPLGRQPMANEDGTVWVVFNGEVYNFRELRAGLEARGHRFRSRTDTEVLVHLYEEEGETFVERLRGMFALAIWDARREELLLARDRVGKKPLYYAEGPWGLAFASELKALLAWPAVSREVDLAALNHYFALGYVPGAASIFRCARKLPPAHTLVYRDGTVRLRRYWKAPEFGVPAAECGVRVPGRMDRMGEMGTLGEHLLNDPDDPVDPVRPSESALGALEEVVSEAVALRMISDVPLGVFLSGGVDSSIVAGLMRRHATGPLRTFSIGFEEARYNELDYARQIAQSLEAAHHEYVVRPDAVSVATALAQQFDEPFADSSAIPTYYVSKLARETVTVALAGDGGDELFAGYNWYAWMRRAGRAAAWLGPAGGPLGRLVRRLPNSLARRSILQALSEDLPARWARRRFLFGALERAALLEPVLEGTPLWEPEAAAAAALQGNGDLTSRLQRVDFQGYLPDDILVKVDRASMLVSLEVRAPLLDHRVCEFAASLPPRLHTRGRVKKHLAKRLARRMFPDVDFERKQGFSMPVSEWMRRELAPLLRAELESARLGEFIRLPVARLLLRQHEEGAADHGPRLWGILMFALWLEAYRPELPGGSIAIREGELLVGHGA